MSTAAGGIVLDSDLAAISAGTIAKPIGRIIQAVAQALADNTQVAVTFTTEDYDTHGHHSTTVNTSRVTPNVAGYYRFTGAVFFEGQTTPVTSEAGFRSNGTTFHPSGTRQAGMTVSHGCNAEVMVAMNGTTDYMELMARQDSAGADNTVVSAQFASYMEWEFVRGL